MPTTTPDAQCSVSKNTPPTVVPWRFTDVQTDVVADLPECHVAGPVLSAHRVPLAEGRRGSGRHAQL